MQRRKYSREFKLEAVKLISEALELRKDILLSRRGDNHFAAAKQWVSHKDAWK